MKIEEIKDIMFNVRNEFENEIDTIDEIFGKNITDDELDIAFKFLDMYINKVELMIDDK